MMYSKIVSLAVNCCDEYCVIKWLALRVLDQCVY